MSVKNYLNDTDLMSSVSFYKPTNHLGVKNSMTVNSIKNYDSCVNPKNNQNVVNNNKVKTGVNSYVSAEKLNKISRIVEEVRRRRSVKMSAYLSIPGNLNKTRSYNSRESIHFSKKGNKNNKKYISNKEISPLHPYNRNFKCELTASKSNIPTKRLRHKNKQKIGEKFECYELNYNWSERDCTSDHFKTVKNNDKSSRRNLIKETKKQCDERLEPHDVWAMLKKMNKFKFRTTPVISEESIITAKKKITSRKRCKKRRKRSVIKTCSSTEVAYISSIRVNARSKKTITPSSSIDEMKVIDMNDFNEPYKPLSKEKNYSNNKFNQLNKVQGKEVSMDKNTSKNVYPRNTTINNMQFQKETGDHVSRRQTRNTKININYRINKKNSKHLLTKNSSPPMEHFLFENDVTCHCEPLRDDRTSFTSNSGLICNNRGPQVINSLNNARSSFLSTCRNPEDNVIIGKDLMQRKTYSTVTQRKQRFVTTMPCTVIDSKITSREIRQRIANIKFPFVILRKDQLSSNFHVYDYEAPQFQGLDEHIWPFMIEWIDNKNVLDQDIIKKRIPICRIMRMNKKQNERNDSVDNLKIKKPIGNSKTKFSVVENKHNTKRKERPRKSGQKQKRYLQFNLEQKKIEDRNEMLKQLFQKCSGLNSDFKSKRKHKEGINKQILNNNSTENGIEIESINEEDAVIVRVVPKNEKNCNKTEPSEFSLFCRKKSSDLVVNIIHKINEGLDHSENNKPTRHTRKNKSLDTNFCDSINESITEMEFMKQNIMKVYDEETITEDGQKTVSVQEEGDILMSFPGFNEPLPPFQIETIGIDTINIKNCETNTTVQFHIVVQEQLTNLFENNYQGSSCVPIFIRNSTSQVFECKKVICSAKLPAEICTILPKIMADVLQNEHSEDDNSNDSFIRFNQPSRKLTKSELALTLLRKGSFASNIVTHKRKEVCSHNKFEDVFALFSKQSMDNMFTLCIRLPTFFASIVYMPIHYSWGFSSDFIRALTAVKISNASVEPTEIIDDFIKNKLLSNNMYTNLKKQYLVSKPPILNVFVEPKKILCYFDSGFLLDDIKEKTEDLMQTVPVSAMLSTEANHNNDIYCRFSIDIASTKQKHLILRSHNLNNASESYSKSCCDIYSKIRGLPELHKCKSTSVLSKAKDNMRALSEITNLENFLELLGLETMSEIFDNEQGKNILSSIIQLRSWISEITRKQAFLVLLLCNKKQTSKTQKFSSTILERIAKKKITRISELDTEVDSIEKDINKLPEYEGFSYLPASEENRKSILEEMCYIAEIAASDYHIPLDGSYKLTLKSFVSKQRKLNPRYLRVMARLTGLGLLKNDPNRCLLKQVDN